MRRKLEEVAEAHGLTGAKFARELIIAKLDSLAKLPTVKIRVVGSEVLKDLQSNR